MRGKENRRENIFENLPEGKIQGFCEPPEGNLDSSVVVDIFYDCIKCSRGCHMFRNEERGEQHYKIFISHPPEY